MNLAALEADALLLGIWKNVEELEDSINLAELEAILGAAREKEERYFKFMAAINGVDLDNTQNEAEEKFNEVKLRAQQKLTGKSEDELTMGDFGIEFETEE